MNAFTKIAALACLTLLSACTTIPEQLQGDYAEISPARVQPDVFGANIRWGGVLVDTRNEADRTCFEILSRELDRYMRPTTDDKTAGRFIACTEGFYDPEVYSKGREVTVTGQITGTEQRKIEEFDYRYPVLEVTDMVMWEKRKTVIRYDGFYDPFYYPYYWGHPYYGGYYPYYRYPHFYGGSGRITTRQTQPDASQVVPRKSEP